MRALRLERTSIGWGALGVGKVVRLSPAQVHTFQFQSVFQENPFNSTVLLEH